MWQTWEGEESGMWRIIRWVNGEEEALQAGVRTAEVFEEV